MSDMFGQGPKRPVRTASPPQRRPRALWITLGIMVALFIAFTGFTSFYTERLWFGSVGYQGVFTKLLWTRIGLFAVFGVVMAAVVALNLAIAYRTRPLFRPA